MDKGNFEAGQPININENDDKKQELIERTQKNIDDAQEFIKEHPEIEPDLAAMVKKLTELEDSIENGNFDEAEMKKNENFLEKLEMFNKEVKRSVAFNEAQERNERARGEWNRLENDAKSGKKVLDEDFEKAEAEIHESEDAMRANDERVKSEIGKTEDVATAEIDKAATEGKLGELRAKNAEAIAEYNKIEALVNAGQAKEEDLVAAEERIRETEREIAKAQFELNDLAAKAEDKPEGENTEGELEVENAESIEESGEKKERFSFFDGYEDKDAKDAEKDDKQKTVIKKITKVVVPTEGRTQEEIQATINAYKARRAGKKVEGGDSESDGEMLDEESAFNGYFEESWEDRDLRRSFGIPNLDAMKEQMEKGEISEEEYNKAYEDGREKMRDLLRKTWDRNKEINAERRDKDEEFETYFEEQWKNQEARDQYRVDKHLEELKAKLERGEISRGEYEKAIVEEKENFRKYIRDRWEGQKALEERDTKKTEPIKKEERFSFFDGYEKEETEKRMSLSEKIKGFFGRYNRVRKGAEKGLSGWRRAVLTGVAGSILGVFLAGAATTSGVFANTNNKQDFNIPNQPTVETTATGDVAEDLVASADSEIRLGVDLNETYGVQVETEAEDENEIPDVVKGKTYGEEVEFNIGAKEWSGESDYFSEAKHGKHDLTAPVYDIDNRGNYEKSELARQGVEGLSERLDDPILQAQFASLGGTDIQIDGGGAYGISNLGQMNYLELMAQCDDNYRESLAKYSKSLMYELVDKYDVQVDTVKRGEVHHSLYAMNIADDGEMPRLKYFVDDEVTSKEDYEVLKFMDGDESVLDQNEIGGYKYNFLKAVGRIPENATDDEAITIMKKVKILGISLKCGQIIWEEGGTTHVVVKQKQNTSGVEGTGTENEDSGTENEGTGQEDTGTENEGTGTEDTGSEIGTGTENEGTGTENEGTGTENEGTGTENEGTGTENEGTGTEDEGTGVEGTGEETTGTENENTGSENETGDEYDGKTPVLPGNPDDGWNVNPNDTPEEEGPKSEAGGENGNVGDNTPGSSSENISIPVTPANPENPPAPTDDHYDDDNSGWKGSGQSEESGTQDVPETPPENKANPGSAGENTDEEQIKKDHEDIMNRF